MFIWLVNGTGVAHRQTVFSVGGGSKVDELSDQKWNSSLGVWTAWKGLLAWPVIHEQGRALRERNSSGSGSQS